MGYKVLGQNAPLAVTPTDLYTVPAATQVIISSITVCNRSATATSYRIAIRPAGAALAVQHYLCFDAAIGINETTALTLGLSLSATDVITVQATLATVTFGVYGYEI